MSMAPSSDSRSVEHILSTIRALADGFNANGSDTVKALDVKSLQDQATVISTILESLQHACPDVDSALFKHAPAEWNTWLTASACARPSSLPGHKSGRRAPQAVPGSTSVWWLDKRNGAKAQLETYIQPSKAKSTSMGVRRSINLQPHDDGASGSSDTVLAVSEHAVAYLPQTTSHIHLYHFDTVIDPSQPTFSSTLELSMSCSVEMPVFRSTEPMDDDEAAAHTATQRQISDSQPLCENVPAVEAAALNDYDSKHDVHDAVLHDATNTAHAHPKRYIPPDSDPDAKKLRTGTAEDSKLGAHADATCKTAVASPPVWTEEVSPNTDKDGARLNRVNALAVSTLLVKGHSMQYTFVCAGGTLALPISLASEDDNTTAANPATEQFASSMVWMVPVPAATQSKKGASSSVVVPDPAGVPATCLLVSNDKGSLACNMGGSDFTGVQSVAVQPVGEGGAICCTADASGTVHVWLLHFEHGGLDTSSARCTQCEMLRALTPLAQDCAPLTINSLCGLWQSARVARWRQECGRTSLQLQVDSHDSSRSCEGCNEYGGCCSCRECGGLGRSLPLNERTLALDMLEGPDEVFKIRQEIEHEILFKEFGNTTAVAMSGKFLFAGSDTGAVAVWECGTGGAVQRVAGWWLEGESVSVLVPARSGKDTFLLVGMLCGKMYSFDTAGQLQ